MMQRERSDVYIIPPNFAKEGTLFSGRIEGRNAFEAAVLFIVLFRILFFIDVSIKLTQILKIRKEKGLTQEEFGKIFHVTRQTVSNWENEKSYPDLQILIDISNRFDISLDVLIKEDVKMVKTMDKERVLGSLKREKSVIDFFTGAGTGIVISCLFSADTMVRTVTIVLGVVMIGIGWYREAKYDKRLFRYMNNEER